MDNNAIAPVQEAGSLDGGDFQNRLLSWYAGNARVLPWRSKPTPYRVWISEIMLQQTRVDTVIPFFERFMKEVPDILALAAIEDDKLLKLWEGLGYYSRARNLKKAAGMIVEKWKGDFPGDVDQLVKLPGIGTYTAGAIASIAFGKRVTAVDGNVLRVMARMTANGGNITDPKVRREIEKVVEGLLPHQRMGDFTQALMELGATVCLPNGIPKCKECPVKSLCQAYSRNTMMDYPLKIPKKGRRMEKRTVLLISEGESIAIRKRPGKGLLPNLWEFPNLEGHLSGAEVIKLLENRGLHPRRIVSLPLSKHIFSHLEWHMIGYLILLEDRHFCAVREDQDDRYPVGIEEHPEKYEENPEENQEYPEELPEDVDLSSLTWADLGQIQHRFSIPTAFKAYRALIIEGGLKRGWN